MSVLSLPESPVRLVPVRRARTSAAVMLVAAAVIIAHIDPATAGARPGGVWGGTTVAERFVGACGHEACLESRLLAGLAGHAPGAYDPATGRDLRNFPPDRIADHEHMTLRLFFPDLNTPTATAVQTLRFTPIAVPLERLTLDAVALDVSRVRRDGRDLEFDYDGLRLSVVFDPPLPPGRAAEIETTYTIRDPRGGMIFSPESPDNPGRPAQVHTQGQPQTSSLWFPCHDFPNERLTTRIIATVPEGFLVCSNGVLVSRTPFDVGGGRYETFDWYQDKPHVNYLVTLVIGKFDVVDVGRGSLPMPVYVPPGRGSDVEGTYGSTAAMLDFFTRILGEPYPWDQYAQLVVWNFGWGGMENTSATTMFDTAIIAPDALADHDLEGLISHELAHQWFGNLVTCNSWEHIWLNEGFATYLTALWFEHSRGDDDYQAAIRGNFDSVIGAATGRAPETPAMVSKVWGAPWETFRRQNNPYPHGASVLHMLRQRLGDDAFFAGVSLYLDRTRSGTAETSDLRRAFEDASGEGLERFFWQWCERPGVPRLDIRLEWDPATRRLNVRVDQSQHIDGYNPAYAIDLPLRIAVRRGGAIQWQTAMVSTDQRGTAASIPLDAEPLVVAVDPDLHMLAELRITQPTERWIAQLEHGPTLAARIQAARAIGAIAAADRADDGADALARAAADERLHDVLRGESLRAMGRRGDVLGVAGCLSEAARPAVQVAGLGAIRVAVRENDALRREHSELAQRVGLGHASVARPATVRAAALRLLGTTAGEGSLGALLEALNAESQHDGVRQAALEALADLDAASALPITLAHTNPRSNSRTRAVAIAASARLAHHDPDAAFGIIAPLLGDAQRRTFLAAGQALVDMGDARGLDVLRRMRAEVPDPDSRWSLDSWIEALRTRIEADRAASSDGR